MYDIDPLSGHDIVNIPTQVSAARAGGNSTDKAMPRVLYRGKWLKMT